MVYPYQNASSAPKIVRTVVGEKTAHQPWRGNIYDDTLLQNEILNSVAIA
jgi:hypothetical protein